MDAEQMQIGEVAERVGLSLRTIRFYEEAGLVVPDARSSGGFRLYSHAAVDRLLLIKQMKPLGFSVEEIGELLGVLDGLEAEDDGHQGERLVRLEEIRHAVEERLTELLVKAERARDFARHLDEISDRARSGARRRPSPA